MVRRESSFICLGDNDITKSNRSNTFVSTQHVPDLFRHNKNEFPLEKQTRKGKVNCILTFGLVLEKKTCFLIVLMMMMMVVCGREMLGKSDQLSNMPAASSKFRRVKCNDMTGVALVG